MTPPQEVWLFAISLVVFWLLVYLLNRAIPFKKYGFRVEPFLIRYESRRFKAFLENSSKKNRLFWKTFSNIGIALALGLMIFALFFLTDNLTKFFTPGEVGSRVVPVLPGLTLRLYWLPYLILAVVVAAVTHEAAHGIVARIEGVSIKSAAAFLLAIFPGGYVDLDQKEFETSSTTSKLRMISAGSAINLSTWFLVFLTISGLFVQSPSGIVVIEVLEGGPLERAGLRRWDVIYAVNDTPIQTYQDLSVFMANVTPATRLLLSTSRGSVPINAAPDPDEPGRAIIGIRSPVVLYYPSRLGLGFFWDVQLYTALNWMFILLTSLAVFNMLPIPLLDGDKFLRYFLQSFTKKDKLMKTFLNTVSLFLVAANMVLSVGSGLFPF